MQDLTKKHAFERIKIAMALMGSVAAFAMVAPAPAHAGLLDSVKRIAKKELSRQANRSADSLADRATGAAARGNVETEWKVEEGESAANTNGDGFPDIITSPGSGAGAGAGAAATSNPGENLGNQEGGGLWNAAAQNSQRIKTLDKASPVLANAQAASVGRGRTQSRADVGTVAAIGGDGVDVLRGGAGNDTLIGGRGNDASARPQRTKLSQNGTTVATANEVQAGEHGQAHIAIDPKMSDIKGKSVKPRPAKMSQNGTTVPTADEVQAQQNETQAALLLPAVQKAREAARTQRADTKRKKRKSVNGGGLHVSESSGLPATSRARRAEPSRKASPMNVARKAKPSRRR